MDRRVTGNMTAHLNKIAQLQNLCREQQVNACVGNVDRIASQELDKHYRRSYANSQSPTQGQVTTALHPSVHPPTHTRVRTHCDTHPRKRVSSPPTSELLPQSSTVVVVVGGAVGDAVVGMAKGTQPCPGACSFRVEVDGLDELVNGG